MAKSDIESLLFNALESPTKLSIIFLLSRHSKMTVTQMSKHVKVGRPNLYHFVNEMVKDGLLSQPEVQVKRNYVEKYYQLSQKMFESRDEAEHRRLRKTASAEQLNKILRSALAAFGLELRLLAEELSRADTAMMRTIARLVGEERIALSYNIFPEAAYDYVLSEFRKIAKVVDERWGDEKILVGGNRIMIAAIPNLQGAT